MSQEIPLTPQLPPYPDLNAKFSAELCMLADLGRLKKLSQHMKQRQRQNQPTQRLQAQWQELWLLSQQKVWQRSQNWPNIHFPEDLPISQKSTEIIATLAQHQVLILAGETGSGKTTQLPKMCLSLGLGQRGLIGHTQPRRLAARSVAGRLAEELGVNLGERVGYQVRFTDSTQEDTLIKVMTDGILLAGIQQDPLLRQYQVLIIDEAHERSLNIDFLLGYLKNILPKRPDLKLIITSATIDVERFSAHFNQAPIIEVSGRTYPVEIRYRPLFKEGAAEAADINLQEGILQAVEEIQAVEVEKKWHLGPRDILVFLPGEREIRETAHYLRKAQLKLTEILPLYARLSAKEQNRIFAPSTSQRRIILSTNVAETSLTVPGIRYVIDPGLVRISRYSYRSKIQRLPIEAISQASANQRSGRCGRISEGLCIRLYSEEDFQQRPAYTEPEIQRTNLAAVILQMLNLRLGEINHFPFIDAPDSRFVKDGLRLLHELGAVDQKHQLTPVGRQLARLPLDPRLARMLLEADRQHCLHEILIITSALNIQDPRERPIEKQAAADASHREWQHPDSDFLSWCTLWEQYEQQRQDLSQNQLKKYCDKAYLSFLRMREWRDTHRQLKLLCRELGLKENTQEASYQNIHTALISGLLSNLGQLHEDKTYLGARNRRFVLFPGSVLYKKRPKWVLAGEIVETSQVYARTLAKIDPAWVEPLAEHLIKRQYFEPHWEKKRAQVVAYERVTLYGLDLVKKRRIHYGPLDPENARDIFIRTALVEGHYQTKAHFFTHNQALIHQVHELEAKARRRDILVDDETLFEFYQARIPEHIHQGRSFERWRKQAEAKDAQILLLTQAYLMQRQAEEITVEAYPDEFLWQGVAYQLTYQFTPGEAADGVTLSTPASMLRQLPSARLEWLVPGMLADKCLALLKSLPKQVRKNFVPLPDYVRAATDALVPDNVPLTQALALFLYKITGVKIAPEHWQPQSLDAHHYINIRVLDMQGKVLGEGRDLAKLQQTFAQDAQAGAQALASQHLCPAPFTTWPEALHLPMALEQKQAGIRVKAYPALIDLGDKVEVQLLDHAQKAQYAHQQGVLRLCRLHLATREKALLKTWPLWSKVCLLFHPLGTSAQAAEEVLQALCQQAFIDPYLQQQQALPRNAAEFDAFFTQGEAQLAKLAPGLLQALVSALEMRLELAKALKGRLSFALAMTYKDVQAHQQQLFAKGFIRDAGAWLAEYPRYLKADLIRLEKAGRDPIRDQHFAQELQQGYENYLLKHQEYLKLGYANSELILYRWMLEEYRVSLYAQHLGTKVSVSGKRLQQQWQQVSHQAAVDQI
ncbi:ATP-dependent helicase HrpA [Allopseudospirillum japonicum]|uniref:ATP-dependent helicase HrpA n=1 Tax=Allopseudospirillum japonicum TaxID=64971 RepID=A0A1H6R1B3_9GAMM|nr:ATP-dependent RNA helicase HrpA [Allopseudospirillum japonicum]SEI47044.1 ATP-dependent helicase HrpA [Allopseudospirillum japonicum]